MTSAKVSRPPARAPLVKLVTTALDDMKAVNVKVLDVRRITDVADYMVMASGTSDRHVRSIADRVAEFAKAGGYRPLGMEGQRDGEWVLLDLNDVIVHVMLPRVREFYGLESLWEVAPVRKEPALRKPGTAGKPAGQSAVKRPAGKRPAAKKAAPARRKPAAKSRGVARGGGRAKAGKARS
jgi:ribosome silencing factor RsfS/YbeB/iojap